VEKGLFWMVIRVGPDRLALSEELSGRPGAETGRGHLPGGIPLFELRREAPLPVRHFLLRMLWHFGASAALVAGSLLLGMAGYRVLEGLSWTDAFLNASMLLGGMGPVESPVTEGGKLFAGLYALYSGLLFLVVAGVLLAPLLHRVLHRFHWDQPE
jgi:hypothetical protein